MSTFAAELQLPLIPYADWVALLEQSASKAASGEIMPSLNLQAGIRLLDVFRSALPLNHAKRAMTDAFGLMRKMHSENAVAASATLQNEHLRQLNSEDVRRWIGYWRSSGFLPC